MRKIWNGKKKCISVLVLAAAIVAMAATSAYGASGIDQKTGTITLAVGTDYDELNAQDASFDVTLYKVADVQVSGKYTVVEPFDTDPLKSDIESVNSETSKDDWKGYAADAKEVVDSLSVEKLEAVTTHTVTVTGGTADAVTVDVGLYLAVVDKVETDEYEYTAAPFLIAVPGNNYYKVEGASDDWIYDVVCDIKFKYEDRYGDLTITKNLETYNASLGNATFVYDVKAVKDYSAVGDDSNKVVYNNVVAIEFYKDGQNSYTIQNIPAGADVTVTEVYSGASYSVEGEESKETEIKANPTANVVEFTNNYNNSLLYQDTVVNSFSHDGEEWKCSSSRSMVSE